MKKRYVVLFILLFAALFLNFASMYYSIILYKSIKGPFFAAKISDTAELSLTVEVPPGSQPEPSLGSGSAGGSGGGGGGGAAYKPKFEINPDIITVELTSGEIGSFEIVIKNLGGTAIIDIGATVIGSYVVIDNNKIVLKEDESKTINFGVNAPEPGVYAGKIIFRSGGVVKESLVLLNILSEGVLFDVSVTIPQEYKNLQKGEDLPTLIELVEIGEEQGLDVTLNYAIKDFDGNLFYSESETLYVFGVKSFSKQFPTNNFNAGDYVVSVELVYPDGFASSSAHFKVREFKFNLLMILVIILAIIAILLVIHAIIIYRRKSKDKKRLSEK